MIADEAVVKMFSPPPQGKTRDKVGAQLGISGHKAERAAAVVRTIDTLEAEGKKREATQLRTTLIGSDDPLDIIEALIESNKQRAKTGEQIGREANALLDVEGERAKRRQLATLKQNATPDRGHVLPADPVHAPSSVQATLPERTKGDARDKVGAQLGISGHKAERAAAVVRTIDTLEQEGKQREARGCPPRALGATQE